MTPELMGALIGVLTIVGAAFGYWRYFEGQIGAAHKRAEKVAEDLAAHKLHVAEAYVSKQGLRETRDEIMGAISGVKTAVENMNARVDRIVETRNPQRSRST